MPRKYVALDQIPAPDPDSLQRLLAKEDAVAQAAHDALQRVKAQALKEELKQLRPEQQALVATFLTDEYVRGRLWRPMSSSEAGRLFGRTATWVRVSKLTVRRRYPCGSQVRTCGGQPECAHARGRRLLYGCLFKALSPQKS